jgi:dolichol kinase
MRYLYTFLLFFSTLLVAFLAGKVGASEMVQRKIVHMGVGNWWFLEMRLFPTMGDALVLPALFILLNGLYIVFRQGESERRKNFGLVYYPVALVVLVILQYRAGLASLACLTGVLCMAYGDSFAAMIGTTWGKEEPAVVHVPENVAWFRRDVPCFLDRLLADVTIISCRVACRLGRRRAGSGDSVWTGQPVRPDYRGVGRRGAVMDRFANLVPDCLSFASHLNKWFFPIPYASWILLAVMLLLGFFAWKGRQLKVDGAVAAVVVGFGITWILGYGRAVRHGVVLPGSRGDGQGFPDVPAGEERVDPKERRDA